MRHSFYRPRRGRSLKRILTDAAMMLLAAIAVLYFGDLAGPLGFHVGVSIIDGDSIRDGNRRIRLYGIDAPELRQQCRNGAGRPYRCGDAAREALETLIGGHEIGCQVVDTDQYGREVARCKVDSVSINREMVRRGWAVAYDRHTLEYMIAEGEARRARSGLWQGSFQRPEDYRRGHQERATGGIGASYRLEDE
ncbi:MAG: thermonuclease family protein [Aestuariivirgaceae bacterium]